jgi:hypothetical protein
LLQLNNYLLIILLIIPVIGCKPNGDNSFQEKRKAPQYVPDEVFKSLREGDIIIRQGGGAFSEQIINFMGEQRHFSHVGIVANVKGKLKMIHSVSEEMSGRDGVQTQSIRTFCSDVADSNLCNVRPKLSKAEIQKMTDLARYYLDQRVLFDYDYHTEDSSKLYCIELLYYTYGTVAGKEKFNVKQCEDGIFIPLFSTFFKPEYFEQIYCLKSY